MNNIDILDAVEAYERISESLGLMRFALALAVSLAAALFVVWLYRASCESRGTGCQLWRAFPALSLAITTLFLCIQISIPLSLGLLGSLSIIRFRTPVKEPEEVGAVMLVIASSIAAATFHFAFIAVMLAFAAVCAFVASRFRMWPLAAKDGLIVFSFPDSCSSDAALAAIGASCERHSVQSLASHDGTTTIQASFSGMRVSPGAMRDAIRAALPSAADVNVFFERPGGFR